MKIQISLEKLFNGFYCASAIHNNKLIRVKADSVRLAKALLRETISKEG